MAKPNGNSFPKEVIEAQCREAMQHRRNGLTFAQIAEKMDLAMST
ncbi:MAG: hypothetical protein JWQ03_3206, partial [Variovorax sp.]|nr:hypothetical protein [Variovorax sp.]